MKERILEVEHSPGEELVIRFRPPKWSVSPQSKTHVKTASKELLLA